MGSAALFEVQGGEMSLLIQPSEPMLQTCAQCGSNEGSQLLCMELHVFVFCIVISALASGLMVASRSLCNKLSDMLRRTASVHNPHLRRVHASGSNLLASESEIMVVQAAEAMDRAAAVPTEHQGMLPARYVRAFCGNEKHATERWKATLAWREENEIDSILNEPQPHFDDIRRYFPSYMSGRSLGGHIVVYEKLGKVDIPALKRLGVTVPMLHRHWIFVSEYMYRVLQPTDSAQQVTIEDMQGVRVQSLAGKIQDYVKGAAQLARLYYVERCHKTYVVNSPAWFNVAFRMVSPFLSARTRQKIRILGKDLSPLLDEIDPQYLPVEYGGKNTVPVFDSAEERHLRRLVDAINANAERTSSRHKKANGHSAAAPKSKSNSPCEKRSIIRKDTAPAGRRNGTIEKASDICRTPRGRTLDNPAPVSTSEPRRPVSLSNKRRTRACTHEGTSTVGHPARGSTFVRRATWGCPEDRGGHVVLAASDSVELAQNVHEVDAFSTGGYGHGRPMSLGTGTDTIARIWSSSVRATSRGAKGEWGDELAGRYGVEDRMDISKHHRRRTHGDDGNEAEDEDEIVVEDRLSAVMKGLGVSPDDQGCGSQFQHIAPPADPRGSDVEFRNARSSRRVGCQRAQDLFGGAAASTTREEEDARGGR